MSQWLFLVEGVGVRVLEVEEGIIVEGMLKELGCWEGKASEYLSLQGDG